MYKFRIEQKVRVEVTPSVFQWVWEAINVSPIYDDSAKLTATREQNEMFCRYDFDVDFTFTGKDYDHFFSTGGYAVTFNEVYMEKDFGGTYRRGRFKGQRVLKLDGSDDRMFAKNDEGIYELMLLVGENLQRVSPDGDYYFKAEDVESEEGRAVLYYLEDGAGFQPEESGSVKVLSNRANIDTEYRSVLSYVTEEGVSTDVISAYFNLTDMEIDEDNRIAKLRLKGKDKYEDFLNRYDAEYDLVQLAPPRSSVELFKRSFLQIYVLGDKKLTNIMGNFEYEVDAVNGAEEKNDIQIRGLGFVPLKSVVEEEKYRFEAEFGSIYTTFNGDYVSENYEGGKALALVKSPSLKYIFIKNPNKNIYELFVIEDGVKNPPYADSQIYLKGSTIEDLSIKAYRGYIDSEGIPVEETIANFYHLTRPVYIYGRIVTDNSGGELVTEELPSDDIWQRNLNYRYMNRLTDSRIKDDISSRIIISDVLQDTPNKWLQDDNGKYFTQPSSDNPTDRVIAIGWNQWIPYSFWFKNNASVSTDMGRYDQKWTLKDAYYLPDAINALLSRVGGGMEVYSEFLENPSKAGSDYFDLYITPITNIKRTYYNQASQRGMISLKQILDMMKVCFNCYWFLEYNGTWNLRIEHISWFRNGGDYIDKYIYRDLTLNKVNLSQKPWITDQRKFSFDLEGIRSRVSYEWGDRSSELFNGKPLISRDNIAKGKEAENLQVANFVADIDIIESSPESLSDDIYVVIGTDIRKSVRMDKIGYYVKGGNLSADHPQFIPQNSAMAFYYLEQKLLNDDVSATDYGRIFMEEYDEEGSLPINIGSFKPIVRERIQVPFEIDKPDLCEELFKTDSGVSRGLGGNFKSISTNLFTQVSEIEMEYTYEL